MGRLGGPRALRPAARGLSRRCPLCAAALASPARDAAAWTAAEARAERHLWERNLSAPERRELLDAVARVLDAGAPLAPLTKTEAPLPRLGPALEAVRRDLVAGRGFALLRRVPVEGLGRLERAALALVLASHFGTLLPQNKQGHLLGHVRDITGAGVDLRKVRIYATADAQPYHTDSADVVGLLCLQPALEGGLSSFCSSVAIFQEILASDPLLANALTEPFHVSRKGEIPPGAGPFYTAPLFHVADGGRIVCGPNCDRSFIAAAQGMPGVPPLTRSQVEALDLLEALAASDRYRVDMMLEPGDLQLLHNHTTLHARSAFQDHAERPKKRHLLRLWMAPEDGIELPEVFAERFGSVKPGLRGGIRVAEPGGAPVIPLDAC